MSIFISEGCIFFHIWDNKDRIALTVQLRGVDVIVYNNSSKYDHLSKLKKKEEEKAKNRSKRVNENIADDLDDDTIYDDSLPSFYQYFPITRIIVHRGCVSVGGTHIPTFFSLFFIRCICLHRAKQPPTKLQSIAIGRPVFRLELHHTECNFFPNPAYTLEESKIKLLDIHMDLMNNITIEYTDKFIKTKLKGEVADVKRKSEHPLHENNQEENHKTHQKRQKHNIDTKGHVEPPVISASLISVFYFYDIPKSKNDLGDLPMDQSTYIQQGIQISFGCLYHKNNPSQCRCTPPIITYGPWMDRQRSLIIKYFFPSEYNNRKIYIHNPKKPAVYHDLTIRLDFATVTKFRFFYRSSGDNRNIMKYEEDDVRVLQEYTGPNGCAKSVQRNSDYITLTVRKDTNVKIVIPWLVLSDKGTTTTITATINGGKLTFGREDFIFLDMSEDSEYIEGDPSSEHFNVLTVGLISQLKWNGTYGYDIDFSLKHAKLYFLWQYVYQLSDLISDWTNGDYPDLRLFIPSIMNFNIHLKDSDLILCTNKDNVIDIFPGINYNHLVTIKIPFIDITFINSSTQYRSRESPKLFSVKMNSGKNEQNRNIVVYISHPVTHPFTQLMNGGEIEKEVINEIAEFHSITIDGFMDSLPFYNNDNEPGTKRKACNNFKIDIKDSKIYFYSDTIEHFFNLTSNYFGATTCTVTNSEYRLNNFLNLKSRWKNRSFYTNDSGVAYPYHYNDTDTQTIISMTPILVVMPLKLHPNARINPSVHEKEDSYSITARINSVDILIHSTPYNNELNVDVSPIAIDIPSLDQYPINAKSVFDIDPVHFFTIPSETTGRRLPNYRVLRIEGLTYYTYTMYINIFFIVNQNGKLLHQLVMHQHLNYMLVLFKDVYHYKI